VSRHLTFGHIHFVHIHFVWENVESFKVKSPPQPTFSPCKSIEKQEYAFMRTTIDLPDPLFREVKATAARQGMRLKDYVTEALRDKLAKRPAQAKRPWMKFAGIAANDPEMVAELKRIE
jgi:hypothetical protein